jgi:hypothetical protein
MREDRLSYSSASDMMAVKHKTAKNAMTSSAPAPLDGGGCVQEVLEAARHLPLRGLVKVDGYVCQEEARDEVVNVQA